MQPACHPLPTPPPLLSGNSCNPQQHFELVSESDLHTAQSALLSEIKPEVESLLSRVDVYLDKLQRREQSLMAKCELQSGRLKQAPASSSARSGSRPRAKSPGAGLRDGYEGGRVRRGGGEGAVSSMEEIKMQQLRQRKERLSYAVGRLELQASQKERQLRRSMAGPGFGLVDDDDDE